jgi:putative ABC transport system permease protein
MSLQSRHTTQTYTVAAIFRRTPNFDGTLMSAPGLARLGGTPQPGLLFVRVANGADPTAIRAALNRTANAVDPNIRVESRDERHRRDRDMMAGAASVYRALTGLAASIGLFGVVGTLVLSIVERRRELGLLRAVGMQRGQVRQMVRVEAVIVSLVGAALGLGLGVLFGWGAAEVFSHSSQPSEFTLPVLPLVVVAALVAIAGVVVAVLPARLAARVDVLRAVAAE